MSINVEETSPIVRRPTRKIDPHVQTNMENARQDSHDKFMSKLKWTQRQEHLMSKRGKHGSTH